MSKIDGIIEIHLARKNGQTPDTYRQIFKEWVQFVGTEAAFFNATHAEVADYVSYLRRKEGIEARDGDSTKYSWSTVCKHMAALRGLYKRMYIRKLIERNPFSDPDFDFHDLKEQDKKRETIPFPEEKIPEMLDAPDVNTKDGIRDRAMLALLFYCGLRASEVVELKIREVMQTDKGAYFLKLHKTKAQKQVDFRIPDEAVEYIVAAVGMRQHEFAHPEAPLFVSYTKCMGNPENVHINRKTLLMIFKHYTEKVGLNPAMYSPHSARFTAVGKLLDAGIPVIDVKKFSRHASIKMVEYYDRRLHDVDCAPHAQLSYKKADVYAFEKKDAGSEKK